MSDITAVLDWVKLTGLQFPGFDRVYYLETNPDVASLDVDPFRHYLDYGWKEGRRPSLGFDGDAYLDINPDVRSSGMNPLVHFVLYGLAENRGVERSASSSSGETSSVVAGEMPGFDRNYYVDQYPDVAIDDLDPLTHYLESGWKEGRKPSRGFDGEMYLALNPDIKSAGINPLVHFVQYGIAEGRCWSIEQFEELIENDPGLAAIGGGARLL